MAQELIKLIIEVHGGLVQGVYCGADGRPLAQVVVVDHDSASVQEIETQGLNEFHAPDVKRYDRFGNVKWVFG